MRRIRQIHGWLGLFFAPSIIFFSFSGALQIFRFNDPKPATGYTPPAWVQRLASIHKDQRLLTSIPDPRPAAAPAPKPQAPAASPAQPAQAQQPATSHPRRRGPSEPLKWFFTAMACGLILSSFLGIWIGLRHARDGRIGLLFLIAGIAVPVLFLFL
jgi:hypothetical protein